MVGARLTASEFHWASRDHTGHAHAASGFAGATRSAREISSCRHTRSGLVVDAEREDHAAVVADEPVVTARRRFVTYGAYVQVALP
jgi:hypothetical protein